MGYGPVPPWSGYGMLKAEPESVETLVVEGGLGATLLPEGRYARMGNVWFLPSTDTLLSWLRKLGLVDAQLVDVAVTTTQEQRDQAGETVEAQRRHRRIEPQVELMPLVPAGCRVKGVRVVQEIFLGLVHVEPGREEFVRPESGTGR